MVTLSEVLVRYRLKPFPSEGDTRSPFKLTSTLAEPAPLSEIQEAWPGFNLPSDAVELWLACRDARLFEDAEYGQWGLALFSPDGSSKRTALERRSRPSEIWTDDVVIGEFLGDQELLVIAPSEGGNDES